MSGTDLYVASLSVSGSPVSTLLIYSLADPLNLTLLGQTPLGNFSVLRSSFYVDTADQHVYLDGAWVRYYLASGLVFEQHGQVISVDVSDPTKPMVDKVVFNRPPSNFPDGDSNVWQVSAVDGNTVSKNFMRGR